MKSHQENDLLDDEAPEPFYRVDENGRLTWTAEGLRTYRRRFARARRRDETRKKLRVISR
jgi:hypothetical protein